MSNELNNARIHVGHNMCKTNNLFVLIMTLAQIYARNTPIDSRDYFGTIFFLLINI